MKHVLVTAGLLISAGVADIGAQSAGNPARLHRDLAVVNFTAGTTILEHKFTPAFDGACTATATFTARAHSAGVGPQRVGLELGQSRLGADLQITDPLKTTDAQFTLNAERKIVKGVQTQVMLTTHSFVNVGHTLSKIDLVVDCQ